MAAVPGVDPMAQDATLVEFLARATGTSSEQVADELTLGVRRRAFVVEELLDAGVRGTELLELVVRLTGLDERQARALVAEHS
jgi:hypothetical protein